MTLILKSNQSVVDPDDKYPYVTNLGRASIDLLNYKNSIEAAGHTMTLSEFNAVKYLEEGIKNLGAWGNIFEIMPFVGSNINSIMAKLKFKNIQSNIPVNGFDASNINSKGVTWSVVQGGGAKAINTGFKVSDAYAGYGFGMIARLKYNNAITNLNNVGYIIGAGLTESPDDSFFGTFIVPRNGYFDMKNFISGITFTKDMRQTPHTIMSSISWDANKLTTNRNIIVDGVKEVQSISAVQLPTTATAKDIYIGASNIGVDAVYTLAQEISLMVFTDGQIQENILMQMNGIINNFLFALGR